MMREGNPNSLKFEQNSHFKGALFSKWKTRCYNKRL